MGFGLKTHTLKVCAAPAHTIPLEVASKRYQNGPMDMESVSKRFGLMRQRSECYIEGRAQSVVGFGLKTHTLKDVCSSSAHDSTRSSQQAVSKWSNGHGKCFKVLRSLRTAGLSAMLRAVHNRLWALGSKNTHFENVCNSTAHD